MNLQTAQQYSVGHIATLPHPLAQTTSSLVMRQTTEVTEVCSKLCSGSAPSVLVNAGHGALY